MKPGRCPATQGMGIALLMTMHAAPAATAAGLEEVIVVGVRPTEGSDRRLEHIPRHVQRVGQDQLAAAQSLDLSDFLTRHLASVTINSAQGNPLQPDLQFRGYTASPLLGLPQGIAVFQDGARLNEPLGDTMNWDLVPESAVHRLALVAGADPLYGPNSLGGALVLEMKNGFNFEHHQAEIITGSDARWRATGESGANDGTWGYYANAGRFQEDGWRDLSPSRTEHAYVSGSFRGDATSVDVGVTWADTRLTGNGTAPEALLIRDRHAIFTAPDVTANEAFMLTVEGRHQLAADVHLSASAFGRWTDSRSLNGDASAFTLCRLGAGEHLLEGLEADDLESVGLSIDAVCSDAAFADVAELQRYLDLLADDEPVHVEDLTPSLSGNGTLSDDAVNNHSARDQSSHGFDAALDIEPRWLGHDHQLVVGLRRYRGEARFDATVELAGLDPLTRSTRGLGIGTFVDSEATAVSTTTTSWSLYVHDAILLSETLTLTVAGRYDDTRVRIRDRSGLHPEVAGSHRFRRFNSAIGATWQARDRLNLYAGFAQSSRAPTPIELTCNETVFQRARQNAVESGTDPDDVDFECRLPNAFVADPPLDQVVAANLEIGARGIAAGIEWHMGLFRHTNRDDIVFQTTGRATGLFGAVDRTRRSGAEIAVRSSWQSLDWSLSFSRLDATFGDTFSVLSPEHPHADEAGRLPVREGDRIPGLPRHQLKLGVDWSPGAALSMGADLVHFSGAYLRGDEANLLERTDRYTVIDLRASYRFNRHLELFARIHNLLDAEYENFGLIAEDPGEVIGDLGGTSARFLAPGPPRSAWLGVRARL